MQTKIQYVEDTNFDQRFETKFWYLFPTDTAPQFHQKLNLSLNELPTSMFDKKYSRSFV